jgi:predicted Zn-dependent peptidase
MRSALLVTTALVLAGCGAPKVASTGPAKIEIPIYDGMPPPKKKPAPPRQSPPSSGVAKESPFPNVARSKLPNGLSLDVLTAKALPVVHARVVIKAGSGYGSAAGIGNMTAEMLSDGGTRALSSAELTRRIESLGANLSVTVGVDSTTIGLALTKDKLPEGLGLLAQVVREPRFDDGELKKYKARFTDHVEDALKSSGQFTTSWVMQHELYPANHPYTMEEALPAQIAKIDRAQLEAHHKKFYVPSNAMLILAGDIDEATAKDLAQKNFGTWAGAAAPKMDFPEPKAPPSATRVIIANRPKSAQSDVYVALLAPERKSKDWAKLKVANQVLGGGMASRLFGDVREARSLAYSTGSFVLEAAHGKQPLVVYAGTQTPKTGEAVTGLLDNLDRMKSNPPSAGEVETARRYQSDIFAILMETVGRLADLVGAQEVNGLSEKYWDEYRKDVRAVETSDVADIAAKTYGDVRTHALIVISGDADVIAPDLAKFGEVTVVDPEKEFKVVKTLPAAK